jgi:hypothetical protein
MILTEEYYILGQELPQCHFVHRKSRMGRNLGIRNERATTTVQLWIPETWKAFTKCGQDMLGIRLAMVYDSATTVFAKAFITYVRMTVPATNLLAVDVFGTGIFR